MGITTRTLRQLLDNGILQCESRGLYRLADSVVDENHDLALVALRVPKGVICLISALSFHNLTDQIPHQVYLALPNDAEKPLLEYPPMRLFWLSQKFYSEGIDVHKIEGVPVKIYNPEKTVADCFKFRNKIGLDVAINSLKAYRNKPGFEVEKIMYHARSDKVERIIQPYLEAIS